MRKLQGYEIEANREQLIASRQHGGLTIVNIFPRGRSDEEQRLTEFKNGAAEIIMRKVQERYNNDRE